ncbi:DinB family protein [Embleya sp. NPDC005575]|uniref:DinB family protein n=1 Tax=Embleya sp. NPDC005575 TaxID=3156892 RepID=UPI0033BA1F49
MGNAVDVERDALLEYLATQRAALIQAADGLTDAQASERPTVSELCLAGLIKHSAQVERSWLDILLQRERGDEGADWADGFRLVGAETLADVVALFEEVAEDTETRIRALPDLDVDAPLPSAPWYPPNSRRSARRVLLHLIQEHARHAGHADIIRESLTTAAETDTTTG